MGLPARIPRSIPKQVCKARCGDSRSYLGWLKTLPCLVCGRLADEPHHLLRTEDGHKAFGRKSKDRWAIPVCRRLHLRLHTGTRRPVDRMLGRDEAYLMEKYQIDARRLCLRLWSIWSNEGNPIERDRLGLRAIHCSRYGDGRQTRATAS